MRRALPLLILVLLAAGCLGDKSSPVALQPYLPSIDTAPGDAVDTALRVTSTSAFKQTVSASVEAPDGWNASVERANLTVKGRADAPLLLHVEPQGANATYGTHLVTVHLGDSSFDVAVVVRDLRDARATNDSTAILRVTRFDANGTLTSTDDPLVKVNASAPANATRLADAPDDARALALREPALREGEARAMRAPDGGVLLVRLARLDG